MGTQVRVCSRCGCEVPWDGVRVRGRVFCCWGCARGQACESGCNSSKATLDAVPKEHGSIGGATPAGGIAEAADAGERAAEAFREGFN